MKARDVMVAPVITVKPYNSVKELAQILIKNHISAVPVVDDDGKLIGIVSEGDLVRRSEAGTERHRPWWLRLLVENETLAAEYVKSHSRKVADIMKQDVVSATPETALDEIATLMEKNAIKRVPILANGQLVGIVSRANLVQVIAGAHEASDVPVTDTVIRDQVLAELKTQPWTHTSLLNVTVNDGVVDLWGLTASDAERKAICIAAEGVHGVRTVNDNLVVRPIAAGF